MATFLVKDLLLFIENQLNKAFYNAKAPSTSCQKNGTTPSRYKNKGAMTAKLAREVVWSLSNSRE